MQPLVCSFDTTLRQRFIASPFIFKSKQLHMMSNEFLELFENHEDIVILLRVYASTGSYPCSTRWYENIVGVKHVLPQLPVLGVPRWTQVTEEVFLATALESQMLDQIVPQLVRPAALVAGETFHDRPRASRR